MRAELFQSLTTRKWVSLIVLTALISVMLPWVNSTSAQAAPLSNGAAVLQIDSGGSTTCAVMLDHTIECVGNNDYGQLGNGTKNASSVPVQVFGIYDAVKVSVGQNHACALLATATVKCWGSNTEGQIGTGAWQPRWVDRDGATDVWPATVPNLNDVAQIEAGSIYTCALLNSGDVYCWGGNVAGELGYVTTTSYEGGDTVQGYGTRVNPSPRLIPGLSNVSKIIVSSGYSSPRYLAGTYINNMEASQNNTCALKTDGSLICWGVTYGSTHSSAVTSSSTEVSGLSSIVSVAIAGNSTCALDAGNQVWCWGDNSRGQLADGTRNNSTTTPLALQNLNSVRAITAGNNFYCATLLDSSVKCWGSNDFGQMLNGNTNDLLWATTVSATLVPASITAGFGFVCLQAITNDLQCWGRNNAGQLSTGNTTNATAPTATVTWSMNLKQTPFPTIVGTPTQGNTLSILTGAWDEGVVLTYQWNRAGTAISGAISPTYVVTSSDVGSNLTVTVTGGAPMYQSVSKTSAASSSATKTLALTPTPTITGNLKVGSVLTAAPGTWDSGVALTYQWYHSGVAISGATSTTYTLVSGDLGLNMSVTVTGTKYQYGTQVMTSATSLAVGNGAMTLTPSPTISGTAKVNGVLTCSPGAWDTGVTFSYKWFRGGMLLSGANSSAYTLTTSDLGFQISCSVTGSLIGYDSNTTFSSNTATIAAADFALTPTPLINGTAAVGATLTAISGSWDANTVLAYQWLKDGTAISLANSSSYTMTSADFGGVITVSVTGTTLGFNPVTRTSVGTAAVVAGTLRMTPVPTISGTAQVNGTLVANTGAWDSGVTYAYQWFRAGAAISGATGATYTPVAADFGLGVSVAVTGSLTNWLSVTKTSASTVIIVGTFSSSPTPTISGTPQVGSMLTLSPSTWDVNANLAIQWFRGTSQIAGATGLQYTVLPSDFGSTISVSVTGSATGFTTVTRTSASTSAVTAGAQVNTPTPVISGTPKVGNTLTAIPSSWDTNVVLQYTWNRAGTPIVGATSITYVLQPSDIGSSITVTVTGTLFGYATRSVTSAATVAVTQGQFSVSTTPSIAGTASFGSTLTVVLGSWDPQANLSYQWRRNGVAVNGATSTSYVLGASDVGQPITVTVSARKLGFQSLDLTSLPTNNVIALALVTTPKPNISGNPVVGSVLTAQSSNWDSGTQLSYQWFKGQTPIADATGSTYVVTPDDLSSPICLVVTGSKPGYISFGSAADCTVNAYYNTFSSSPVPTISGTVAIGQILRAVTGTWDSSAVLSYQWYSAGAPIDGATSSSYTVKGSDAGNAISLTVTGIASGYATTAVSSEETAVVPNGQFTQAPVPQLVGIKSVGRTLTAVTGTWSSGAVLSFEWFRNGVSIDQADASTYVLVAEDQGAAITVAVTGSADGFDSVTKTSAATTAIALGSFIQSSAPKISGTYLVGNLLVADEGVWDSVAELSFQWYRNGAAISGATDPYYQLTAADRGKVFTVTLTGTATGYKTLAKSSIKSPVIGYGIFTSKPLPQIQGTVQVGQTLSSNAGSWDLGVALTYQWKRGSAIISGAKRSTYVLTSKDKGKTISLTVTASLPGYKSVSMNSNPTSVVTP